MSGLPSQWTGQPTWNILRALLEQGYQPYTQLPTKGNFVGRRIPFKAATGIYWDLLYTGEATYPWAKVGGPPLRAEDESERTTTSETMQTTGAPSIEAPLLGQYRCTFGAREGRPRTTEDTGMELGLFVNAGQVASYIFRNSGTDQGSAMSYVWVNGVEKLGTVQTRYRTQFSARQCTFTRLFLEIDPIRVG